MYKLDILRNNKLIERLINTTILTQNLIIELPKSIDEFDLIFFELTGSDINKGWFHSFCLARELTAGVYSLVQSSEGTKNGFLDFIVPTRTSIKIISYAYLTHINRIYGIKF